jgi:hypothetical protein
MAATPPSAAAVWCERYERALGDRRFAKPHRDFIHDLLTVELELGTDLVLRDGGWQPNPHQGDREHAAAERRRLWGELGEWLGIGPPPESLFAEGR